MVDRAREAMGRVLAVVREVADILDERVDETEPSWSARRGWTTFLLGLSDDELRRCEAEGLGARLGEMVGVPSNLAALAGSVREVTALPILGGASADVGRAVGVRARKVPQLGGLRAAVDGMARHAARIVDVGAGSGHFIGLAGGVWGGDAIGIERDLGRVAAAEARYGDVATFRAVDAGRETLAFEPGDLAVGLHACGALGDRLVIAAAEVGCDVALVSCCAQKIEGSARRGISRAGAGFELRREVLGLANLTSQAIGVETSIEATMAARQARYALLGLLRERGETVAPGEEMRGINRRRARLGLAEIAQRALARRGLSPASEAELREHEERAARTYAAVRRLSLPRNMLARLVEVAIVLDRAALLEESGLAVRVGTVFERAVTPRNVAVLASRRGERLPL